MAVGDIIQLRLEGQYLGQAWQNVFYYRVNSGTGNAAGSCLNLFEQDVLGIILNAMVDTSEVIMLTAVNGMNNGDQYSRAPNPGFIFGTVDAVEIGQAPSNAAVGFRSNRNGIGTRYSYKRFGGVPLEWIEGNAWTVSAGIAHDAIEVALGDSLSGAGFVFQPYQVSGGFKLGVAPTATFPLTNWQRIERMSTQNTRVEGRGA